jgi:hypothetical protein
LTIGVLGPLVVRVNGEPVTLGGRRQAAVLVALLLERGRVVSTDALIEAVWAGQPPAAPQAALQAYVSHLRKRLDPDGAPGSRTGIIERVGPGYALRVPDDAVDAWRFENLVGAALRAVDPVPPLNDALALWRGVAVTGYADEDWARPTAQRWTALRGEAQERLYAARLDQGDDGCWPWRCIGRTGRPMRWRRCAGSAPCWPTSWGSIRRRRCAPWRSRFSISRTPWCRPAPTEQHSRANADRRRRRCQRQR